LDESNVSSRWDLAAENIVIIIEQLDGVLDTLNWILKSLIHEDVQVELLVSPVDLKNWLESSQEQLHLSEGRVDDVGYHFLLVDE